MKTQSLCPVLLAMIVVACSGSPQPDRELVSNNSGQVAQAPAEEPKAPAAPVKSPTVGGDGSAISLSPLTSEEIGAADLEGELGCSFADAKSETLLVAMGDVASKEPSFGVVKVGDYVESISARGGFDGMLKGTAFTGKGKTIVVARTSSKPVGGGESPPYPATLTYQRADGASRSFDGTWTCGP